MDEGSSYSGCTHYPVLEEIKYENEPKPKISTDSLFCAVKENPQHLQILLPGYVSNLLDCKQSSVQKSETGTEMLPENIEIIPKADCDKHGLSAADYEDILKVESNDPGVSKEEVCDFLEDSGYNVTGYNSTVFPKKSTDHDDVLSAENNYPIKVPQLYSDLESVGGKYLCNMCEGCATSSRFSYLG